MKKSGLAIFIATLVLCMPLWAQSGRKSMQNKTADIVTLKGEITNVLKPLASFKADDGKEYKVHLGPIWYWKKENLDIKKGNAEITGTVEENEGVLHLYPNKMVQGQVEIALATESGTPKWCDRKAGGSGKGQGQHGHKCCGNCRRK